MLSDNLKNRTTLYEIIHVDIFTFYSYGDLWYSTWWSIKVYES